MDTRTCFQFVPFANMFAPPARTPNNDRHHVAINFLSEYENTGAAWTSQNEAAPALSIKQTTKSYFFAPTRARICAVAPALSPTSTTAAVFEPSVGVPVIVPSAFKAKPGAKPVSPFATLTSVKV